MHSESTTSFPFDARMTLLSRYNREHLETFRAVREHLARMRPENHQDLLERIQPYLGFREEVAAFQEAHFSEVCTLKCFQDRTSACCGREGIAAFFADVVVNTLLAAPEETMTLIHALEHAREGSQCVYLGDQGCLWRVKPIVCEMFLCHHAMQTVLAPDPALESQWKAFRARERQFTWPDRPVLFDDLESFFLERGCDSPLMYFHKGPGLLRVKAKARARRGEATQA